VARTVTFIHTPEERRNQRADTEKRLRVAVYRFAATTVMLRHGCSLIAEEGGAAGWWLMLLCMLPGLTVAGLLYVLMRRCACGSVPQLVERTLGPGAVRAVNTAAALALTVEGLASLTALATMFVDGVGTAVGMVLFAAMASAVLCLCTQREGILHGIGLLRWVLGVFAAVVLANTLMQARLDHLFPPGGVGASTWVQAGRGWWGMAWPLSLLLWEESPGSGSRSMLSPVLVTVLAALALSLALPHELLSQPRTLAERMLLPGLCLEPGVRLLLICLWTAGLGVTALIAAARATDLLALPWRRAERWLPCLLLTAYAALQLIGADMLEASLLLTEDWLLAPFALLAVAVLFASCFRRKKR